MPWSLSTLSFRLPLNSNFLVPGNSKTIHNTLLLRKQCIHYWRICARAG